MPRKHSGVTNVRWESFMAAMSILTILNNLLILFPRLDTTQGVALIVQMGLTPIFAGDFLFRFLTADSKTRYMLKGFGWADLLSVLSLSGLRLFRVFSIYRFAQYVGVKGRGETLRKLASRRSEGTLLSIMLLAIVTVELSAIYVLKAESHSAQANIKTAQEALWWSYVTLTTIGYGDFAPVTAGGRIVAIALMTIGVGIIGSAAAFLANWFLQERPRRLRAAQNTDDILIEMRKVLDEQERMTEELHRQLDNLNESRAKQPE